MAAKSDPKARSTTKRASLVALLLCTECALKKSELEAYLGAKDFETARIQAAEQLPLLDDGTHLTAGDLPDDRAGRLVTRDSRKTAVAALCEEPFGVLTRGRHCIAAGNPSRAKKLLQQGLEALAAGDPSEREALTLLLTVTRPEAKRRELGVRLAEVLLDEGLPKQAENLVMELGIRRPRKVRYRMLLARLNLKLGRLEAGLRITRALLRKGNPTFALLRTHALLLLQLGHSEAAYRFLDAGLGPLSIRSTMDEVELSLLRDRAIRESNSGDQGSRISNLFRALAIAKRRGAQNLFAQSAWALAIALSESGAMEASLRYLAISREQWDQVGNDYRCAEAFNSEALILAGLERIEEAREAYLAAIDRLSRSGEHDDALAVTRLNFVSLLMDQLDLEEALQQLRLVRVQQGLQRMRKELMGIESRLLLGSAPDLLLEQVLRLEEQVLALERPSAQAHYFGLRSLVHEALSDREDARADLLRCKDVSERMEDNARATRYAILAASHAPDWETARKELRELAIESRPDSQPLLVLAAAILRSQSKPRLDANPLHLAEAERAWSRFLALRSTGRAPEPRTTSPADTKLLALAVRLPAFGFSTEFQDFVEMEIGADRHLLFERGFGGSFHVKSIAGPIDKEALLHAFRCVDTSRLDRRGMTYTLSVQHEALPSLAFAWSADGRVVLAYANSGLRDRFGRDCGARAAALCEVVAVYLDLGARAEGTATGDLPAAAEQELPVERSPFVPEGAVQEMRSLRRQARSLANSDLPLSLIGETGAGKDRLARWIHELSDRKRGPYFAVDCSSLSSSLGRSELLGHVAGAFTGAHEDRAGILELANGGTLVLDEVSSLSDPLQGVLLRALDQRRVRRLGSFRERSIDVRVLSLSRAPLDQAAREGSLRSELLYRLQGIELRIPPLRDRQSDIPMLVQSLIRQELGGRKRAVDRAALATLMQEPWPGNVRELANRIRRALLLEAGDDPLSPEAFSDAPRYEDPVIHIASLSDRVREAEREALQEALAAAGGHRAKAAEALGISRRWLQQRLKALGLT